MKDATQSPAPAPPLAMLAELTHRCPLACPYCSNPVELTGKQAEMGTAEWARIFAEAAALGVFQLHLSGGEPASRPDLVQIVQAAREAGLYTNLITSGIGLNARRLAALERGAREYLHEPVGPEVRERWYGWRPMSRDDMPLIGRAPGMRRVWRRNSTCSSSTLEPSHELDSAMRA